MIKDQHLQKKVGSIYDLFLILLGAMGCARTGSN
jgi:L-lactate permease